MSPSPGPYQDKKYSPSQNFGEENENMEENKTNVTETKQEDKGLSQIQPNEKRSWWSIAFIWVGTMICIPMLMVGGIFEIGRAHV